MMHVKCLPVNMHWTIVPASVTVHPCSRALVHVQHIYMHTLELVCNLANVAWHCITLPFPHVISSYKNTIYGQFLK